MTRFWWLLAVVWLTGCSGPEAENASAEPESAAAVGEDIYNKFCFSCHAAGIAGAPMLGDAQAWSVRAAQGEAAMLQSTVEGIVPGMPPMGLCLECSEGDLLAAIDYMIAASQ